MSIVSSDRHDSAEAIDQRLSTFGHELQRASSHRLSGAQRDKLSQPHHDKTNSFFHRRRLSSNTVKSRSNDIQLPSLNSDQDDSRPEQSLLRKSVTKDEVARMDKTHMMQPRPLKPHSPANLFALAIDVIISLTPISFLVLAVLAYNLDGQVITSYGDNIKEWTLLSPTIFPLFFAAVVGRSLQNIARYRLERGCQLKDIEQLSGIQSVFSALSTHLRLGILDVTGLMLTLLWLISPLGGQASLRLLSTVNSTVSVTSRIGFANLSNTDTQLFDDLNSRMYEVNMNGLYTASIASPLDIKQGPMDAWGNIKIPVFESLTTMPNEQGFWPIHDDNLTDWASLLGLPVTGLSQEERVNATITAQYYYIDCTQLYGVDGRAPRWPTQIGLKDYNNTNIWMYWTGSYDSVSQWLVWFKGNYSSIGFPQSSKMNMTFASWSGDLLGSDGFVGHTSNVTIANCTIEPAFVDLQIVCQGFQCRTAAARQSSKTRPDNSSDYDANNAWWGDLLQETSGSRRDFFTYWTTANLAADTGQIAPTLFYMGGAEGFPFVGSTSVAPRLYELPLDIFTQRLRRLFNTYWQGSFAPMAYNASIPKGEASSYLSGYTTNHNSWGMSLSSADATFEHDVVIWKTHKGWLAVTIITTVIEVTIGLIGVVAKCLCVGPDVLGSLTTVLRFNSQTAEFLQQNSSTLDSSEVTRSNKSLRVTLTDVRPDGDVGFIAISAGARSQSIADNWKRNSARLYG